MTKESENVIAKWHESISQMLRAQNYPLDAIDALLEFDVLMFHFQRRISKGEILAVSLAQAGVGLEVAQFQALTAVARIKHGIARAEPAEPTVGLIAEEMSLDPSRASRIVADLVRQGHVTRASSQGDGRKSVIELSAKGENALYTMLDAKWNMLDQVFSSWSKEDIVDLSRLMAKYMNDSQSVILEKTGIS